MKRTTIRLIAAALLAVSTTTSWAAEIDKQQAIEKALAAHPGSVEKAYQETKKGVLVWEVKVKGDDGNTWKSYFRVDNGDLFMKKKNDQLIDTKSS